MSDMTNSTTRDHLMDLLTELTAKELERLAPWGLAVDKLQQAGSRNPDRSNVSGPPLEKDCAAYKKGYVRKSIYSYRAQRVSKINPFEFRAENLSWTPSFIYLNTMETAEHRLKPNFKITNLGTETDDDCPICSSSLHDDADAEGDREGALRKKLVQHGIPEECQQLFWTAMTGRVSRHVPCGRTFHTQCLDHWLMDQMRAGSPGKCPMCRDLMLHPVPPKKATARSNRSRNQFLRVLLLITPMNDEGGQALLLKRIRHCMWWYSRREADINELFCG